jgi:hypothetical protein
MAASFRSRLMQTGLIVYGLLYIEPNKTRHANINSRQNSIDIYLLCAANSARSCRQINVAFKLALQLPFLKICESMGNHDSKIVDADSVD